MQYCCTTLTYINLNANYLFLEIYIGAKYLNLGRGAKRLLWGAKRPIRTGAKRLLWGAKRLMRTGAKRLA